VGSSAAGANRNPLEAADVVASGVSAGPDLSLAVFAPDALTGSDVVAYIFDEAVQAGVTNGFRIYSSTGAEVTATAAFRSSENNATVTALFPDTTLAGATYVGASVLAGSVTEADGAKLNQSDEVGVAPSAGPAASAAGKTDGPDLTAVAINTVVSPFGTTSYTATYTFDEDTADTAVVAGPTDNAATGNNSTGENVILNLLHLYTSDGIDLTCSAVSGSVTGLVSNTTALTDRTEDNDATITCSAFTVGAGGTAATAAQVQSAVVGTVDFGAVDDETAAGGDTSPEGAELTSGGNGTPTS
jgi:hypothetical protein